MTIGTTGPYGPFSEQEVSRIAHFLGYPRWQQMAASIQLGYPSASQPYFLFLDSLRRITPGGVESIRADLCQCESIERQMADARGRMRAAKVGEVEMRSDETSALREELVFWTRRLADDLGVVQNPYSQMEYQGMGGGLNAKVQG